MPVKVHTYLQRHFDRPGYISQVYRTQPNEVPRALESLYCLKPDPYTGALKRGPAWTQAATLPTGLTKIAGAFYDQDNQRFCFIGRNASNQMTLAYTTNFSTWSSVTTLTTATTLGGLPQRNVAWWGGYLWVVGADGKIYRGTSYTASLSAFYTSTDAEMIAPMNDRLFAATTSGSILRLTATPSMGAYHTTVADLDIIYLAPFRQYLLVVAEGKDDTVDMFRLPDWAANALHQTARIPAPGYAGSTGCPCALYDDKIWVVTGAQWNNNQPRWDVYAFDGSQTTRHAIIDDALLKNRNICGLLTYHNQLLFYGLDSTLRREPAYFALVGESFQLYTYAAAIGGGGTHTPFTAALSDYLVAYGIDSSNVEQLYYASRRKLMDGYFYTPRLDFGHLGQKKRLHSIAVLTDNRITDFKIVIKYRVDNDTTWTTAVTGNNTRLTTTEDLKLEFDLLQVRIDVDDDSAEGHQDFAITALEIKYSVNTYT